MGYKYYVVQYDTLCARCMKEVPKGTRVLITDEDLICQDCAEELDARAETY